MRIALIRRMGRGGAAGYADRLAAGLRAIGFDVREQPPAVVDLFRPPQGVRIALERSMNAHVYRAGGGVHAAWRTALGRVGPSPRAAWDAAVARSARAVIANSRRVADELLAVGVPARRVEVVRTGVDPRFQPLDGAPSDRRVVLFAGHGWRRKGAEVAARAFADVRGPADRFWVVGSDSRRATRIQRLRKLVPDLVDLGPWADLTHLLPRVAAVVQPTRYDPASNLVLEAMACGVPPVSSWMDGSAEIVPEGRLVVSDPTDAGAVARALRFALDAGPALRSTLLASASRWPDSRNALGVADIARRFGE